MTDDEKKERIQQLWQKLRLHVKAAKIVKTAKMCVQDDFLNEFAQNAEYTNINLKDHVMEDDDNLDKLPWYLLREESICMQIWETIVSVPLVVFMFACPLIVSSQKFYTPVFSPEEFTDPSWFGIFFMEFLWTIEMIVGFFKVPAKMDNPTLKKTAKAYMRTFFIFDFVSTVVGNTVFFLTLNIFTTAMIKLVRIVRM